jgi:hypothetical protein
MKKLLCIAVFSIAIMANANNKKEIATSNFEAVKIEKTIQLEELNAMAYIHVSATDAFVFGECNERGNRLYENARKDGNSHREARQLRRADVRKCRGLPENGWLGATLDAIRELNPF